MAVLHGMESLIRLGWYDQAFQACHMRARGQENYGTKHHGTHTERYNIYSSHLGLVRFPTLRRVSTMINIPTTSEIQSLIKYSTSTCHMK
jgi:hypothetical protein